MWFLARCLALSFPLFLSGSHNELPHPRPPPQASQRERAPALRQILPDPERERAPGLREILKTNVKISARTTNAAHTHARGVTIRAEQPAGGGVETGGYSAYPVNAQGSQEGGLRTAVNLQ